MRCRAFTLGLAVIATAVGAKAENLHAPYHFCTAFDANKQQIYYSDVFNMQSTDALENAWEQYLIEYHSGTDIASASCDHAAQTRRDGLDARDAAVSYIRRTHANFSSFDTEWAPNR